MPAKYNVVPRGNPANPDAPKKYYASVISSGRIELRQLAEQIASISTVSSIDTLAVLEAFLQTVPKEMSEGNIVDLGEFGSFRLRISSDGQENPEDVNASVITKVRPRFAPGKEFKKIIEDTSFEKASG